MNPKIDLSTDPPRPLLWRVNGAIHRALLAQDEDEYESSGKAAIREMASWLRDEAAKASDPFAAGVLRSLALTIEDRMERGL